MQNRVIRIAVIAVVAEILAVAGLVVVIAIFGPSEREALQAYAERLAYWVGPLTGFGFTLFGGWWVAKGLSGQPVLNGLLLGVAVATIDVTILVAGGAEFQAMFTISIIGRVIAGSIGGWLVARSNTDS